MYTTVEVSDPNVPPTLIPAPPMRLLFESRQFCMEYCDSFGAKWAMVQFGEECFCGDANTDVDQYGTSDQCNKACAGDSSLVCGGNLAFNVYELCKSCQYVS